jgi:CheY-like chemotaxis protein
MAHPRRILVVDDNQTNREIIEEILEDEYEVINAANGLEALVMAHRYHPRIVLLDVMLPEVDGYFICRKLRAIPEMAACRIIMVTAKAMPSERALGFASGADYYLTKPFDEADLLTAITSARHLQKSSSYLH